jgi:hypothetical protein
LDRCRLYVPARNLWAALTAELARQKMGETPKNLDGYREVGQDIQRSCRFSYLYPSVHFFGEWKAWLPCFENGKGLCWRREGDSEPIQDRSFRRQLLDSRPGTAIDPGTDSAAEGSLHETEVLSSLWKGSQGSRTESMALTCYLFCKDNDIFNDLCRIGMLFVGGDVRYGLGKIVLIKIEKDKQLFGYDVQLDQDEPQVCARVMLAHSHASENSNSIYGALERLGGWDLGKLDQMHNRPLWAPGSKLVSEKWHEIRDDGTWVTLAQ